MEDDATYLSSYPEDSIKNEGSATSLLSINSPVLVNNSPKECVLSNAIEENVNQNKHIKLEKVDVDTEEICDQSSTEAIYYNCSDKSIDDIIEARKREIIENETTVYKCQECDGVFRKYPEYKMHRTEHSIDRRTCKICHILFQGITKLKEHMNVHKGIKPFECSKCKKRFISAHTLKSHMDCHQTEIRFKCEKCGKGFKTKRLIRGHMDTHAKKIKDHICKICNEEFDFISEYRRHLTKHGADLPQPKCTICDKTFNSESQLKIHLGTHKELKFPCEYCNKIFPTMTKIRKHVKRTHVINECEFCKMVFYDKSEFTKHKKTEHVEEKPSICNICNKAYDKMKNLQEHIRVQHTKDGLENKCEFCEKKFINRFLLHNHVKTHDKCFKCSSCNMLFASRYNLQLHSVTHTNEKRYKCTLCPKAFSSKVGLQTHVTTHYEERPYVCSLCDKSFKNNRRLYVHKRSHETELKFECYTCGHKFKTKEYLKAHMYKHYKVKPFDCPNCQKQFKHKKTLEKHLEKKHHRTSAKNYKNSNMVNSVVIKKEDPDDFLNEEQADYIRECSDSFNGDSEHNDNFYNVDMKLKMEFIQKDHDVESGMVEKTIAEYEEEKTINMVDINDE